MTRPIVPVAGLLLLCGLAAAAEETPEFAAVAGHGFGERITVHAEMVRYLEALDDASPRVRVVDQGASWEGRRLLLAIVTSPENHARLDAIREGSVRLGDPRRTTAAQVDALVEDQPAVVWLGGSIHGFELSGSEGLLKLLEHLTNRDDDETRMALDECVVLIDPMLNPDGRDAFAHWNHQRLGREPNPLREDWANQTSRWQGIQFRTSHYFFDINRDWFAHTHPETRHRVATWRAWRPQVAIDAHEMGPDTEFYFDPPMPPFGAHFPPHARRWFERFNVAYAAAFDAAGFGYTTGELFNYYYPGYTTSYSSYQGAVGMLYEQGSTRGLALEIGDGSVRRLADALEQQYTAAWAAVATAARQRRDLLREYHEALRETLEPTDPRRYLVPPTGDPALVRELAALLLRNGIEVAVLDEAVELDGRAYPAGTLVVEAAQPRQRLLRTLLEPDLPLDDDFLAAARERLDRGENPRFYDVTAWSLPLAFGLEGVDDGGARPLPATPLAEAPAAPPPDIAEAAYAYLFDGRSAAALAAVHRLRNDGYRAAVTVRPGRLAGADVPSGTGVVWARADEAPPGGDVHAAVREAARRHGVAVRAVDTGLVESAGDGELPALGSAENVALKPTRVAILAEQPVHGYSFGWAWYVLDHQYRVPVTVLPAGALAATPLHRLQTLVIPDLFSDQELAEILGEDGRGRLRRWVEDGGNLVALGAGVDFVLRHLELPTGLRSWYEENKVDDQEPRRFTVPGAFLRAELDLGTWLTAGYESREIPFWVFSDRLYLAPEGPPDASRRVAARVVTDDVRLAGHLWPESLERLPGAVLAYEGRVKAGRMVLFAEDLNFRGFWRGSDRLFLNAVLLGPSAP